MQGKYKKQLTEKQQQVIDLESQIQELNDNLELLKEQIEEKEELVNTYDKKISELKKENEALNIEYKEREERLAAITEKLADIQTEYDKLLKAKEVIEKSINDSKILFQQLKTELENQEKEIRDKESRIQRLEILSGIYRASKYFGGILIGFSIFLIVFGILMGTNLLALGSLNNEVVFWISTISAVFIIISGIFHLLKS